MLVTGSIFPSNFDPMMNADAKRIASHVVRQVRMGLAGFALMNDSRCNNVVPSFNGSCQLTPYTGMSTLTKSASRGQMGSGVVILFKNLSSSGPDMFTVGTTWLP